MCGEMDTQSIILGQRFNCRQGLRTHRLQGITTTVKKCSRCGLVYTNPIPVPLKISDHYDVRPEEYWGSEYLNYDPGHFSWQTRIALELLNRRASCSLVALDIGCGVGKDIKTLHRNGFDCYGIEPSRSFCGEAIALTGLDNSRIICESLESATFQEAKFDFINFGAVFEHLYHPAASLAKVVGWLKPGGIVHIEVPSSRWLIERLYHIALKMKGSECTSYLSPMHAPYHLYSFSIESFRCLSSKLGLDILRHDYHVNSALHTPRPLKGLVSSLMRKTNRGMQLTVWLGKPAMINL